ncbi:MAG: molybdate ABC transporter substrate-binding protein [Pseudomonadota bacterium]
MRPPSYRFLPTLLLALALCACGPKATDRPLQLFAAASLGEVAAELAAAYQREHPDTELRLNLAGSNVLARQIGRGATADLFISANKDWIDRLDREGLLITGGRSELLANRLVIVANRRSDWSVARIEQLPELAFRYLALADPQGVPAGIYARRFLDSVMLDTGTLWQALSDRLAPAADVRRALAMARADPSVLAVVYDTDAVAAPDLRVLFAVPEDAVVIRYEAALIQQSRPHPAAEDFFAYLASPAAKAIYRRFGFLDAIP